MGGVTAVMRCSVFWILFLLARFASAAVDLNLASQAEIESLPGIGPQKAEAVMAYRRQHGPFRRVEDLQKVPGIGPKTVQRLRGELQVTWPVVAKKPVGR